MKRILLIEDNDDHADLRDLCVLLAVPPIAEAVRADRGARVDDDAIPDGAALANHDAGKESRILA